MFELYTIDGLPCALIYMYSSMYKYNCILYMFVHLLIISSTIESVVFIQFVNCSNILTGGVLLHNYVIEKCIYPISFSWAEKGGGAVPMSITILQEFNNYKFAFFIGSGPYRIPPLCRSAHDMRKLIWWFRFNLIIWSNCIFTIFFVHVWIFIHIPIDSINVNDTCYLCFCYTCVYRR